MILHALIYIQCSSNMQCTSVYICVIFTHLSPVVCDMAVLGPLDLGREVGGARHGHHLLAYVYI